MNKIRVLIIESDNLIRELLTRWLMEAGYSIAAEDSRSDAIALVIADVKNPASADAALKELRCRYEAPILATSGRFRRGPADSERAARRLGVAKALPKPFTFEELLAAVKDCLASR